MAQWSSDRTRAIDTERICWIDRATYLALLGAGPFDSHAGRNRGRMAGRIAEARRRSRSTITSAQIPKDAALLCRVKGIRDDQLRRIREDAEGAYERSAVAAFANLNRAVADVWRELGFSLCGVADGIRRLAAKRDVRLDVGAGSGADATGSIDKDEPCGCDQATYTARGGLEGMEPPIRTAPRDIPSDPKIEGR